MNIEFTKQELDDLIWSIHRSVALPHWEKKRLKRTRKLLDRLERIDGASEPTDNAAPNPGAIPCDYGATGNEPIWVMD